MRITSKGQVTIPQHIREQCGFLPGTEVDFVLGDDGRVVLIEVDGPGPSGRRTRGDLIVAALRGAVGSQPLSTDDYMAMIRDYDEDAFDPGFGGTPRDEVA